jgi:hypothetical protein
MNSKLRLGLQCILTALSIRFAIFFEGERHYRWKKPKAMSTDMAAET